jgi:hypothetical protein
MIKSEWLAAGVLLILSSIGLVNGQKYAGVEFAHLSSQLEAKDR